MPSLVEAQLRHAKCYVRALKKADSSYIEGGLAIDPALRLFELEQANIERGRAWAERNLNRDLEAASLCLEYVLVGRNLLGIRQQASILIHWLEVGLLASRQVGCDGVRKIVTAAWV